jgi:hypothetical protein
MKKKNQPIKNYINFLKLKVIIKKRLLTTLFLKYLNKRKSFSCKWEIESE